ncbi:pyridoxamine 5'-phosphate oxidase family protein [Candidatus Stoquefichus sp. SB1]|uniref:pyridoxamine 5'-phosphate oxidase family protein n=1 Tax=Candidatus Stoquefichus sp. SB1 TaxID=1658109 RepID=UPI00067F517D|nr:pyridoxamine 5'-phosphate oxidase family protein [Candidatus Stoquefichus sp. SB1]
MNTLYTNKYIEIYQQIGDHAKIVLATSYQDKVSVRTMSFVIMNGLFYFQTDNTFRKYQDIKGNENVGLCLDNIQIEGICKEIGHPLDHPNFCNLFKKYFLSSYQAYSHLKNERLFIVEPTFIQRWNYVDGKPIIEQLNIHQKQFIQKEYKND